MKVQQVVSMAVWAVLVPTFAATATARQANTEDTSALEASQCWGRCSACTTRCTSMYGADRERCERSCQAGNESCCENSGRHAAVRACGCY
jgi:hypothetical protein